MTNIESVSDLRLPHMRNLLWEAPAENGGWSEVEWIGRDVWKIALLWTNGFVRSRRQIRFDDTCANHGWICGSVSLRLFSSAVNVNLEPCCALHHECSIAKSSANLNAWFDLGAESCRYTRHGDWQCTMETAEFDTFTRASWLNLITHTFHG